MPDYIPVAEEEEKEKEGGEKGNCLFIVFIIVVIVVLILGAIDSMTTHFFKAGCLALAQWTMDNAPGSFIIFEIIILLLIVCCMPYGPLAVLSGALFYQKYGLVGVFFAWIALFLVTFVAAMCCFFLARYAFKETVQGKIAKNPKLGFLKNLDKLIVNGQGIEMVVLIRVAPLPKGPTNYFLGTTQVTWRDFIIGSIVVGLPECLLDVSIGAGAKGVKHDSPLSVGIFVVLVALFMGLMCYVGARAQAKLKALDDEDEGGTGGEGGAPASPIDDAKALEEGGPEQKRAKTEAAAAEKAARKAAEKAARKAAAEARDQERAEAAEQKAAAAAAQ